MLTRVPGLSAVLEPGAPVDLGTTRDVMMDIEGVRRYRGPRFRLSGTVFYRPLQPYDPAPTIPSQLGAANNLVAFEYIGGAEAGFEYPPET